MATIKWYGPRRGPGSVEDVVSHMDVVQEALEEHAQHIARDADRILDSAPHRTGSATIQIIRPPRTPLDRHVYLVDPNGFKAAASIEFGYWHATKGQAGKGYYNARDEVLEGAEGPIKRGQGKNWIPGLHPISKAVQKAVTRGVGKV